MPQVPRLTSTQVQSRPLGTPQRVDAPDQTLNALGQATEKLAQIGAQVYEYDRKQKLTQLSLGAQKELQDFQLSMATDRDYDTQPQRYREKVTQISQRIQSSVDPRMFKSWQLEFAAEANRGEFDVQKNALKGKVGEQKAVLNETLTTYASLAGNGNDEAVRAKGLQALDEAYQAGLMEPEEFQTRSQKFRSDIVAAGVRREILDDPELAERKLLAGDFPDLSGQDRLVWTERATARVDSIKRQRLADEDRALRLHDKAQRELEDATSKQGDKLLSNGQLTPEWIEQNRDNLSPDDLRYFYRKMSGDEAQTDPMVYSGLRERAGLGEDVRAEARAALQKHQISTTDFDRITGEVEQQRPGWYKRGSQYISTASAVSDLNPDPAAAQRKAAMQDDWYQWAKENPKATDEQADREYKRIVQEYGIIDLRKMTLTKRAPTYLAGGRNQPDIEATIKATAKALEDGLIDEREFARQSVLIEEWEAVLMRAQPQQKPATKP